MEIDKKDMYKLGLMDSMLCTIITYFPFNSNCYENNGNNNISFSL